MKHDAHVKTAFMHFLPTSAILFLIFASFAFGLYLGNIWGFKNCLI